jgi:hypothetical protein
LLQRLQKRGDPGLSFRLVSGRAHEHAHAPHPLGLLRACDERPKNPRRAGRSAEQGEDLAAFHACAHSMISSA